MSYLKLGTNEVKQLSSSPISRYNSSRSFSARKNDKSPIAGNKIQGIKHTLPSKVTVHDSSLTKNNNSPSVYLPKQDNLMSKSASATNYFQHERKEERNENINNAMGGVQSKIGLKIR